MQVSLRKTKNSLQGLEHVSSQIYATVKVRIQRIWCTGIEGSYIEVLPTQSQIDSLSSVLHMAQDKHMLMMGTVNKGENMVLSSIFFIPTTPLNSLLKKHQYHFYPKTGLNTKRPDYKTVHQAVLHLPPQIFT